MDATNLCFARSDLVTELYFRWTSLSASPHSLHSREVPVMLSLGDHRYLEGCSDLHIHKKPMICTDDDPCSAQFSYLPTQAPHYVLSPKASENIQPLFVQFWPWPSEISSMQEDPSLWSNQDCRYLGLAKMTTSFHREPVVTPEHLCFEKKYCNLRKPEYLGWQGTLQGGSK